MTLNQHPCNCTSVVIKVPGIQGAGIIWETLTEEEKQDIAKECIEPIQEYVETSKSNIQELKNEIIGYKDEALLYKQEAAESNRQTQELTYTTIQDITSTGTAWQNTVIAEGNTQIAYLKEVVGLEEGLLGLSCYELTWEVSTAVSENSEITLPNPMYYIPLRNHLRVNWNGIDLQRDISFAEIGTKDTRSSSIKLLMPLEVGDVITAWTIPLGRGNVDELLTRIKNLEDSLADLSRNVVYRE